jgi:hypothetical protein
MGTNVRVCFLTGMGGRSLVDSQGRKVKVFLFFKELVFWWCGMGAWRQGVALFFFFFFVKW